jgi:hypothetical protein
MTTTIVQYSIPRTGSTLITQILKQVFPDNKVFKTHNVIKQDLAIVSTYRDFRDVLVSGWRVHHDIPLQDLNAGRKITSEELDKNLRKLISDIKSLEGMKAHYQDNMLLLKYEDFIHNYDYVFSELVRFFQVEISEDLRNKVKVYCSIDKNLERSGKFKTFRKQWDKDTLIHGLHIYKRGEPGGWKHLVPEELHYEVNSRLKKFLIRWGYECQ